eukprot:scaffold57751_cov63-Phaeocystis_antarctica.AAC.3
MSSLLAADRESADCGAERRAYEVMLGGRNRRALAAHAARRRGRGCRLGAGHAGRSARRTCSPCP